MTMIIKRPDWLHCIIAGLTKVDRLASRAPASPPRPPARTKAISLKRITGKPTAVMRTSFSRIAWRTCPKRELSSRHTRTNAAVFLDRNREKKEHVRERQGDHYEIHPARTQTDHADDGRGSRRDQRRQGPRDPGGHHVRICQHDDRVSAQSDKR